MTVANPSPESSTCMDESLYRAIAESEDTHWWYLGMRFIFRDMLARELGGFDANRRIVDVGAGTGGHTSMLADFGAVTAIEPSPTGRAIFAEKHGYAPLEGDAGHLPMNDHAAQVVTLLDVIEHLDDDMGALREAARVLEPGGLAFIFTSAFQLLWSRHDEVNGHKRRYRKSHLARLLREAGFETTRVTYVNPLLFPPAVLVRLAQRMVTPAAEPAFDIFPLPKPLNAIMYHLLKPEAWALRYMNFPVGLSLVALGRTPSAQATNS